MQKAAGDNLGSGSFQLWRIKVLVNQLAYRILKTNVAVSGKFSVQMTCTGPKTENGHRESLVF